MWYLSTMEYYSAIKKNEIMPFVTTWMDLEIIILSQRKTDIYRLYANVKNNDRKELIYKTETDSHRKQTMVTKRERCGEWGGMG